MTTFGSSIPEDQFDPTQQIPFDEYALSPDMSPMMDAGSHDLQMQPPTIPPLQAGMPAISQEELDALATRTPVRSNQFPGAPSPEALAEFQQMLTPPEPENVAPPTPLASHSDIYGTLGETAEDVAWRQLTGQEAPIVEAEMRRQEELFGPSAGMTDLQRLQQMSPQMSRAALERAVDAQSETRTYTEGRKLFGYEWENSDIPGGATAIERRNAANAVARGDFGNPAVKDFLTRLRYGDAPKSFGDKVGEQLSMSGNRIANSINFIYEGGGSLLYALTGGEWGQSAVDSARATAQYMAAAQEFAGKGDSWYEQVALDVIGTLPDLAFQYTIGRGFGLAAGIGSRVAGLGTTGMSNAQRAARIAGFMVGGGGISASATFTDSVDTYMRAGMDEGRAITNALIDAGMAGGITAATSALEGAIFPGIGSRVVQKAARASAARTFVNGYYRGSAAEGFQEWSEGVGIDIALGIRRQSMDEFEKFYEENPNWVLDSIKRNVYDGLIGALVGGKVGAVGAFSERAMARETQGKFEQIRGMLPEAHPIRRMVERGDMTFDEADYAVKKLGEWRERIFKRTPDDTKAHRDIGASLDYSKISDEQLQTIALGGTDTTVTAPFRREVFEKERAPSGDSFDMSQFEERDGAPLPRTGVEYAARQQMVVLPVMAQDELIRRGIARGEAIPARTVVPGMRTAEVVNQPTEILAETGADAMTIVEEIKWVENNVELARRLAQSPEPISRRQMEQILGGRRDWNNAEFRANFKEWISNALAGMTPQAQAQKVNEARRRAMARTVEEITGLTAQEADRVALGLSPRQARVVSEILAEAQREAREQPFAERSAIDKMRITQDAAGIEAMQAQRALQEAAAAPVRAQIQRGDVGRAKEAKEEAELQAKARERLKVYVAAQSQKLAVDAVEEAAELWQESRDPAKGEEDLGSKTRLEQLIVVFNAIQSMAKARNTTWADLNLPPTVQQAVDAVWNAARARGPVNSMTDVLARLGISMTEMSERGESMMADLVEAAKADAISQMDSDDRAAQEHAEYVIERAKAIDAMLDSADEAMMQDIADLIGSGNALGVELSSALGRGARMEPLPPARGGPVAEALARVSGAIDLFRRTGTGVEGTASNIWAQEQAGKKDSLVAKQQETLSRLEAARSERSRLEREIAPLVESAWLTKPTKNKPAQRRKKRTPPTDQEKELSRSISKVDEQIASLESELAQINQQMGVVAEEVEEPQNVEPTASFPNASPRRRAETIVIMRREVAALNGLDPKDIKIRYDNGSTELTNNEKKLTDWGKKFGVTVVFVRASKVLSTPGAYHAGVVMINQSQADSPASWFKIAMHEGVHHMRQVAPEVFEELYRNLNRRVGKSLRAIGARYTKNLTNLIENTAVREAALTMLNDDQDRYAEGLLWLVRNDDSPEMRRLIAFMPQQLREALDAQGLGDNVPPSNIEDTRAEFKRVVGVKRRRPLSKEKLQEEEVANLAELLADTTYTNLFNENGTIDYDMLEKLASNAKTTGRLAQFASMIMDAMYSLPILKKHAGLNPKQAATLRRYADNPNELRSPRARRAAQMMIAQAFKQMMDMRRGRVPLEDVPARPMSETVEQQEIPALNLAIRDMNAEREELENMVTRTARTGQPGPLSSESLMLAVRSLATAEDPVSLGRGKFVESQQGITAGGIFETESGEQWYFKKSTDVTAASTGTDFQYVMEALRNEVLSALLAESMGAETYQPIFATAVDLDDGGQTMYGIATRIQPNKTFSNRVGNWNFESVMRGWAVVSALNITDMHSANLNYRGQPMDFGGSLMQAAAPGQGAVWGMPQIWDMLDSPSDLPFVDTAMEMVMINPDSVAFGNPRTPRDLRNVNYALFQSYKEQVIRAAKQEPLPGTPVEEEILPAPGAVVTVRPRKTYKSPISAFGEETVAAFLGGISHSDLNTVMRVYATNRQQARNNTQIRDTRHKSAAALFNLMMPSAIKWKMDENDADGITGLGFIALPHDEQRAIIGSARQALLSLINGGDIEVAMAVTKYGGTAAERHPDRVREMRNRMAFLIRLRAQMALNTLNTLEEFIDPRADVELIPPEPIVEAYGSRDWEPELFAGPGQPAAPMGEDVMLAITAPTTDEFTTWFGNSKIVTPDGNPMPMYHGTPYSGFTQFFVDRMGNYGPGAYFTNRPGFTTTHFAQPSAKPERSGIYPTFLSIQNPLDMNAPADGNIWKDNAFIKEMGFTSVTVSNYGSTNYDVWRYFLDEATEREVTRIEQEEGSPLSNRDRREVQTMVALRFRNALMEQGYDGAVVKIANPALPAPDNMELYGVAWLPQQIKSFSNRRPTWASPFINFAVRDDAREMALQLPKTFLGKRAPSDMTKEEMDAAIAGRLAIADRMSPASSQVGSLYEFDAEKTGNPEYYRITHNETPAEWLNRRLGGNAPLYEMLLARLLTKLPAMPYIKVVEVDRPLREHMVWADGSVDAPMSPIVVLSPDTTYKTFIHELTHAYTIAAVESEIAKWYREKQNDADLWNYRTQWPSMTGVNYVNVLTNVAMHTKSQGVRDIIGAYLQMLTSTLPGLRGSIEEFQFLDRFVGGYSATRFHRNNGIAAWRERLRWWSLKGYTKQFNVSEEELSRRMVGVLWQTADTTESDMRRILGLSETATSTEPIPGNRLVDPTAAAAFGYAMTNLNEFMAQTFSDSNIVGAIMRLLPTQRESAQLLRGGGGLVREPFTSGPTTLNVMTPMVARVLVDKTDAAVKAEPSEDLATSLNTVANALGEIMQIDPAQQFGGLWKLWKTPAPTISLDPRSDDAVMYAVRAMPPIPEELQDASKVTTALEIARSRKFDTIRDFKEQLQDSVRAVANSLGYNLEKDNDNESKIPVLDDYLVEVGYKDALTALSLQTSAIGWYNEKVRKALAVLSLTYPELATSKQDRFAMIVALAITSNGLDVIKSNFPLGTSVYEQYKKTGKFPEDMGQGQNAGSMNDGFWKVNQLIREHGIDWVMEFFSTKRTVSEVEKMSGQQIAKEAKSDFVYGAAILGGKIGNGFFANMYGHYEQLTIDRWLMRTWGRWTGTLIMLKPAKIAEKTKAVRDGLLEIPATDLRRISDEIGVPIIKTDLKDSNTIVKDIARRIARRTTNKTFRRMMSANDGVDQLRRDSIAFARYEDGSVEAPEAIATKKRMRRVINRILDRLRIDKPDLTMADLQAVYWYPEKRLYETAKSNIRAGSTLDDDLSYSQGGLQDFSTAAIEVAKARGISDKEIERVIKKVDAQLAKERGRGGAPAMVADGRAAGGRRTAGRTGKQGKKRSVSDELRLAVADIPSVDGPSDIADADRVLDLSVGEAEPRSAVEERLRELAENWRGSMRRFAQRVDLPLLNTEGTEDIEIVERPADINPFWKFVAAPINIAIASKNPDVISVVEDMIAMDVDRNMTTEARKQEARFVWESIPVDERNEEEFARYMDEYHDPATIDSDPEFSTKSQTWRNALKWFKEREEIRRQEIIETKREGVARMLKRDNAARLVSRAAQLGLEWQVTRNEAGRKMIQTGTGSLITIDQARDRLVKRMVSDDWGMQYAHFFHWFNGEYKLVGYKEDGTREIIGSAMTEPEAFERLYAYRRANPGVYAKLSAEPAMRINPDDAVRLSDAQRRRLTKLLSDATGAYRDDVADAMRGIIGSRTSKRPFYAPLMTRTGAKGFSEKFMDVWDMSERLHNRWKMGGEMVRVLTPRIEAIRRDTPGWGDYLAESMRHTLFTAPTSAEAAIDSFVKAIPFVGKMTGPFFTRRLLESVRWLNYARQLVTVRQQVVNSFQPFQTLYPILGEKGFMEAVSFYNSDEGREVLRRFGTIRGNGKFYEGSESRLGTEIAEFVGTMNDRIYKATNENFDPSSESRNQNFAFVAMYLHGKNKGMTDEEAARYGRVYGNVYTQFYYTKANIPWLLRGPIATTALQYRRFAINTTGLLVNEFQRGNYSGVARYLATMSMLGGMQASIGLSALSLIRSAYLGDKEGADDLAYLMRQWLIKQLGSERMADVAMMGLPAAVGIDLSGSLSIWQKPFGRNLYEKIGASISGPSVNTALQIYTNLTSETALPTGAGERIGRAVMDSSPTAQQIISMWKLMSGDNEYYDARGRLQYRLDPEDQWKKMGAFRTVNESVWAMEYQRLRIIRNEVDRYADRAATLLAGNQTAEARKVLREFNSLYPMASMTFDDIKRRVQQKRESRTMPQLQRRVEVETGTIAREIAQREGLGQ